MIFKKKIDLIEIYSSFILGHPIEREVPFSRVARLAASYIFQTLPLSDAFRILGFERQSEHIAIDRHLDAVTATDYARVSLEK